MGEAARKKTTTQRLLAVSPDCYFCGGLRKAVDRDHVPPKGLFDSSHRPKGLEMPACKECNHGTSTADLAVSIISRWGPAVASAEVQHRDLQKLMGQARVQAPELVAEWDTLSPEEEELGRVHLQGFGVKVPHGALIKTIGLHSIKQLNLFAHKAALALYFERFRHPLPLSARFCAFWKTKEDRAYRSFPSWLVNMMPNSAGLMQGKWDERKTFEYRFAENREDGLFCFLARLRLGLFLSGFVVLDGGAVPADDPDWLSPSYAEVLLQHPRMRRRDA